MIARLLRFSLARRWLVLLAASLLLLFSAYRGSRMPVDVFPDLTAPRVTVVTEAGGLAAEEVEKLVTLPIETSVNGVAGVRRVRSASSPGISLVWVEFDWDTEATLARQRVTERLQGVAGGLPPETSPPALAPASSVMGEIAFIALTSKRVSALELRRLADNEVRRRLLGVQGIAQVIPIGGAQKQFQIIVDPQRLGALQLTLAEVSEAVRRGSQNAPGGFVVEAGQESVVRVLGRAQKLEDLQAVVIAMHEGVPVRVRDVAEVEVGAALARGAASYGGTSAVILSVVKQPDADTASTTTRMDEALVGITRDLKSLGVEVRPDVFRQQDFIDRALENLITVLRDGAVLVVLVLFAFMWSVRPTLISAVAIPLSLGTAVLVLDALGLTIDTMTLGGLAIAIGELVDDAIVDVENVVRHLRERLLLPIEQRSSVLDTVLQASLEIRSSIVSATYIIMLVFVPLLLLDGLEGRLLRPLAIAYLVAIFASLVVAVTVTPALCLVLLPKAIERSGARESPATRWLLARYEPILSASLRHPTRIATATLMLIGAGVASLGGVGRSFLPEFNEGSLTINMVLAPGTPLSESDSLARMAERALLRDPAVIAVGRRTGRAERDEHVLGVETSELEVRLRRDDQRARQQLLSDVRERLKVVPGAAFEIGQPISHRIEHMISGQRAALAIKVFGENLGDLRRSAERVKAAIQGVPGLVDLNVEQVVEIPQLVVQPDAQLAASYGFSTGTAAEAIGAALWGTTATQIYEGAYATDVIVKYAPDVLSSADAVRRVLVPSPSGALVPVSALAEVRSDTGPNYVLRENVQRRIVVTANVSGRDLRGAYQDARATIDRVELPAGVRLEYSGQFEREEAAALRLLVLGILAILGIGLIVATTLGSLRQTFIVLLNLPLALVGGVGGVYLAGGVLSVATTIGFITLFGIATRNGILLATRMRDLQLQGRAAAEAAASAARERLAPILMTAVTAALGLLPLAMALGRPGSEIQAPMALVILTGLATSTVLNMLVVPTLLARWGQR
ncbi:MAG TPA: efflux RND transporter permease subunit [Polyangiaceae bacterium]|nr:efflux RND transporter permease subunit [Polyangiaceae bacterium]